MTRAEPMLNVVVFSGGRGSEVLSRELLRHPRVALTLAINGYDDGASTGEVRRFLGDSLGPSDFRKNGSRLARELETCPPALVELLDLRFPAGFGRPEALAVLPLPGRGSVPDGEFASGLAVLWDRMDARSRRLVADRLAAFEAELERTGRSFQFSDCSLGNLVFAGGFLVCDRNFNAAVADYCELLRLPPGMIENVTDGTNAYLVALDSDNRVLGSEADIVDGARRRRLKEIFLIDRPLSREECDALSAGPVAAAEEVLRSHARPLRPNPVLLRRLREADLIISAPGTQHSSLFPSYMTPEIGTTIAANLTAFKLLITNIQQDAEIGDSSAVDIIDRAVHYLREKGRNARIPTPCLITHYLINDPGQVDQDRPYVPLGRVESLEDPRLVRIGNYEDGMSGRHDAATVVSPFVSTLLSRGRRPGIAVLLLESDNPNLLTQSLLEMLRGGVQDLAAAITVFYSANEALEPTFVRELPFEARNVGAAGFGEVLSDPRFEFVVLFESSGMYRGEDVVNLASLLTPGTLDAVWGSRRLSVSDIRESYRLRYRHKMAFGAVSYVGSHLLSLAYLVMYGHYVSDTLSGVRAIRTSYLRGSEIDLNSKRLNHEMLSAVLSRQAGVFETPVRFFPLSPRRVRRTTILDGLQSLFTIVGRKLRGFGRRAPEAPAAARVDRTVASR